MLVSKSEKKKSNDLLTIKRNTLYLKTPVEIDEPYVLFFNSLEKIPLYYQYFIAKINSLAFKEELWNVDIKPYFRKEKLRYWYKFLTAKWYFDLIYNEILNRFLLQFAYDTIFSLQDKGVLELFGPLGISSVAFTIAFELKKMQMGRVYYYAYFMLMFLFVFLISLSYFF